MVHAAPISLETANGHSAPPSVLSIEVTDLDVIRDLFVLEDGPTRTQYAVSALRIGILALKQARGQLDGDLLKLEGEKLLASLEQVLVKHTTSLSQQLNGALKEYFDPESGRFHERVQRLVRKDGELEEVLRRQVGYEDSELCKTLTQHLGRESPLMRILSPKESDGLLKAISDTMSAALADQRKRILDEFSLDNKNGALNRLVEKLTEKHGEVSNALQGRIDVAVGEFSLDKRDSALSRLVRKVTKAQRTISSEFSLDNEKSALSRMSQHLRTASETIDNHLTLDKETSALFRIKRELQEILAKHAESAEKFQSEVIRALDEMKVRRDEWQRAPIHGKHFQQVVHGFVQGDCKLAGEVVTFVGDSVGAIKNCKVGDTVLELGEDHVAAGACIVIEAKDKDGFTLQKARWEIEQARTNREAGVGVFVFARATAPEGLEPFQRLGDDIFVVWDPEDLQSDIYLRAALMVARALCSRRAKQRESNAADLSAIDKAINEVEKKIGSLEDIQKHAETIRSGAEKILERTRVVRESIERQVSTLRESIGDLKKALAEDIRAVSAGARAN